MTAVGFIPAPHHAGARGKFKGYGCGADARNRATLSVHSCASLKSKGSRD
jgi:hypothetical protein